MMEDYLQLIVEVSVTVYVFLLGLPILVYQIFLPDDLRRMSKKNYAGNLWWRVVGLTLIMLFIILTAYPEDIAARWLGRSFSPHARGIVITALFMMMLLFTLWILFDHLIKSQGYRAKIVEIITRKILRQYRREGVIDRAYLEDLEYLGVNSKAGAETRIVIESLEELLRYIRRPRAAARDDDVLIAIIETLCDSVANSVEVGSRQNMVEVLTIYKSILMDLRKHSTDDNPLIYGNETRKIRDCTTKIALTALKKDYSDMMPLVLNVLTLIPLSSDKLFDIGLMALGRGQYQIAANVLAEIMDRDNRDELTMYNYLGLVAHFCADGEAARQYAMRSMSRNQVLITEDALEAAARHHFVLSNFATADRLRQLRAAGLPVPDGTPGK